MISNVNRVKLPCKCPLHLHRATLQTDSYCTLSSGDKTQYMEHGARAEWQVSVDSDYVIDYVSNGTRSGNTIYSYTADESYKNFTVYVTCTKKLYVYFYCDVTEVTKSGGDVVGSYTSYEGSDWGTYSVAAFCSYSSYTDLKFKSWSGTGTYSFYSPYVYVYPTEPGDFYCTGKLLVNTVTCNYYIGDEFDHSEVKYAPNYGYVKFYYPHGYTYKSHSNEKCTVVNYGNFCNVSLSDWDGAVVNLYFNAKEEPKDENNK